jgi:hypothetical protein
LFNNQFIFLYKGEIPIKLQSLRDKFIELSRKYVHTPVGLVSIVNLLYRFDATFGNKDLLLFADEIYEIGYKDVKYLNEEDVLILLEYLCIRIYLNCSLSQNEIKKILRILTVMVIRGNSSIAQFLKQKYITQIID